MIQTLKNLKQPKTNSVLSFKLSPKFLHFNQLWTPAFAGATV